ncbi:hypothetical protein OJF2_45040 [Aquisphaera giovannonii]|uniref:Uncharacterized protein n=1 Tax=Aquisphaera giovannonii TaxID=406548 RepID=A0A5B9W6J4_9BACT|nr:hypothetical protein [Aquisphaera giovannonii]QEH35947.1 hypothetical protein OJF2_45040 [Aquisphaera giovannonii]
MENEKKILQTDMDDNEGIPDPQPADEGIILEAGGTVGEKGRETLGDEGHDELLASYPDRGPKDVGRKETPSDRKKP